MTTDFWNFSLALYARPGVADYCLHLQDETGANVNLMLLCCWAGQRGMAMDADTLAAAIAAIAGWETQVLRPLRARRRAAGVAPAEKRRLRAAELRAEQHAQALLLRALADSGFAHLRAAAGAAGVRANLRAYGKVLCVPLGCDDPLTVQCLTLIAHKPSRGIGAQPGASEPKSRKSNR